MLLRALRPGDRVLTPSQRRGRVQQAADRNDRVLVRYPGSPDGAEVDEELIEESLLTYIEPRRVG